MATSRDSLRTFVLSGSGGGRVVLTNYGARVMAISMPDRHGRSRNIVLGFASPESYLSDECYLGATIGHIANRVSRGRYSLDGRIYRQHLNDGPNSNHGGRWGLDRRIFECTAHTGREAVFVLETPDGPLHPGNMRIEVAYILSDDNELRAEYRATTDRSTPLNLTNHTYFNLSGGIRPASLDLLRISARTILETDAGYIPTGRMVSSADGPYDFRRLRKICDPVPRPGPCRHNHYHILDRTDDSDAMLYSEVTGIGLEITTSYPGILFYSGDFLRTRAPGLHGRAYLPYDGVCLEAQLFPDAVNRPEFPPIILYPGETYRHFISYRFVTRFLTAACCGTSTG